MDELAPFSDWRLDLKWTPSLAMIMDDFVILTIGSCPELSMLGTLQRSTEREREREIATL